MRNLFLTAASTLTVAVVLLGNSLAQQAPASAPKPSTAPNTGTAAKPHPRAGASTQPLKLTTKKDKVSYAIGMNIGGGLKKNSLDVDPNIVARGLKDALTGSKPLLTEEEANAILTAFRTEIAAKRDADLKQMGETNKQAGEQFLAANKAKQGVVTLSSGLQYKVLQEGSGPKPTIADSVVCQYRGTLIDGTEFDSSYRRGQPTTFPVAGVIKGWTEALQLMPVGSKWQLFVPADLAYGERSRGPKIGPNSTLIFEVELLSIQDKNANKNP
jgi:FKBP-type peptidyl-prolyl cis-trans isomerase FklB